MVSSLKGHWRGGGQSLEGRRTVTGGAEDSHWRGGGQSLEGRRTVTGGAEDSYWRGAGQRTVTGGAEDSHWRGGGQLLEGRRTVTGMTDVPQGHRTLLPPTVGVNSHSQNKIRPRLVRPAVTLDDLYLMLRKVLPHPFYAQFSALLDLGSRLLSHVYSKVSLARLPQPFPIPKVRCHQGRG